MLLTEKELIIPLWPGNGSIISFLRQETLKRLRQDEIPVRFAITETTDDFYLCENGILSNCASKKINSESVFGFSKRKTEDTTKFNAVLIIPTGIGAEIGGHAGDANPVARLLASACDTLITHPNVVNASDINELPENGLYVEGSVITQLLMGTAGLEKVRSNRVMIIMDKHKEKMISELYVNSVSAARATLGLECSLIVELDPPIKMKSRYSSSGCAVGRIESLERIVHVLDKYRNHYDAVALVSMIDVPFDSQKEYFDGKANMANPWGGVEAMLSHTITMLYGVQSAHAPMAETKEILKTFFGVVDPRMSAEVVSNCCFHSVLKGLHKSPRIIRDQALFCLPEVLSAADISCIVIPDGCVGLPTLAALEQGIPVIAVKENKNYMKNNLSRLPFPAGKLLIVDNYVEAAGAMTALKSGVSISSVRRPLEFTKIIPEVFDGLPINIFPYERPYIPTNNDDQPDSTALPQRLAG